MKQNQNRLKERREALNLTQKEVADHVGIAIQVYQRYEYGERLPQVNVAITIAEILKSTVEELFIKNK